MQTIYFSAFLSLVLIGLSSCSGISGNEEDEMGNTRFYSLTALATTKGNSSSSLRIGVGPIEIPRLLNRPQIVSRKNETEIQMSEFHQWGGSFKEELIQAITDNLSVLLKTDNIEQFPWKFSFKPQYQVRINIEQFDGQKGKNIKLKARWRLIKNNKEILVKHTVIHSPIHGNGYDAYVKAQSKALIILSQQISKQIK